MPRIVPAAPQGLAAIDLAADILRSGNVVAFPTETVYGLGAATFNVHALDQVYELKGRPADNPLIAHVLDAQQAKQLIAQDAWDERCDVLAQLFWPGPLTLVLGKSPGVPDRATAGRPTIAVRSPVHPVARALIERFDSPISAPSANRSGRVSPTSAQHVMDEFAGVESARDLLILDGGSCAVGIESTVLDLTAPPHSPPRVLRHGSVTIEQLQEAIGEVDSPVLCSHSDSPGTSASHYAPRTPTMLVAGSDVEAILRCFAEAGRRCAVLAADVADVPLPHVRVQMSEQADRYAHDLYQRLREADALDVDRIVIVQPQGIAHAWRAINDRLRRATAPSERQSRD